MRKGLCGKTCAELFDSGLSYAEIAKQFGGVPKERVGSAIYYYRKRNGLVAPHKGFSFKAKHGGYRVIQQNDEQIRQQNAAEAVRRDDGVLVCPPRYSAGYGLNKTLNLT